MAESRLDWLGVFGRMARPTGRRMGSKGLACLPGVSTQALGTRALLSSPIPGDRATVLWLWRWPSGQIEPVQAHGVVVALKVTPKALSWTPSGASLIQRVMLKGTKTGLGLPLTVCALRRGWRSRLPF